MTHWRNKMRGDENYNDRHPGPNWGGWAVALIAVAIIAGVFYTHWVECYDFFGIFKGCTAVKKPF